MGRRNNQAKKTLQKFYKTKSKRKQIQNLKSVHFISQAKTLQRT